MTARPLGVSITSQPPAVVVLVAPATGVPDTRLKWHVSTARPVAVTTLVPDPS